MKTAWMQHTRVSKGCITSIHRDATLSRYGYICVHQVVVGRSRERVKAAVRDELEQRIQTAGQADTTIIVSCASALSHLSHITKHATERRVSLCVVLGAWAWEDTSKLNTRRCPPFRATRTLTLTTTTASGII